MQCWRDNTKWKILNPIDSFKCNWIICASCFGNESRASCFFLVLFSLFSPNTCTYEIRQCLLYIKCFISNNSHPLINSKDIFLYVYSNNSKKMPSRPWSCVTTSPYSAFTKKHSLSSLTFRLPRTFSDLLLTPRSKDTERWDSFLKITFLQIRLYGDTTPGRSNKF